MSRKLCLSLLIIPLLAACSYEKVKPPMARGALPQEIGNGISAEEAEALLATHNRIRAEVGVQPLQWSSRVAQAAQDWADHLSQRCSMSHNPDTSFGENLFMGTAYHYKPVDAALSWEKEKAAYRGGPLTRENWSSTGHYTQMVWSRSQAMGCGVTQCGGEMMIVVCNYDPVGNVLGQAPF